jgi:RPA family protein
MNEQGQFKRNVAYKLRIGELFQGKPVMNGDKFSFLELGNKKIVRVNLVGNIIDKYESPGESKYIFFTLDDGSGQIKLKLFGEDSDKFKTLNQGETVVVIGVLRYWNNETYLQPEIISSQDPKYLLLRKLEIESERSVNSVPVEKSQIVAIKDKILSRIKSAEEDGGVEVDKLIIEIRDASPDLIHQEIKKLIEDGIVFEPRPGKVRYLG